MRSRPLAIALVTLLCVATALAVTPGAATQSATDAQAADATLVAAYPNPVERGDPGEFVLVRFPTATNTTGWTLTDGKTVAWLPNRTVSGTVALSTAPNAAAAYTDRSSHSTAG